MRMDLTETMDSIPAQASLAAVVATQGNDFHDYLEVLRRRWPSLVFTTILLFAIAVVIARKLPPVYEANAKILVESQRISTDPVQPTVSMNAMERVEAIEQRLTTRDNLLDIVRKFYLYPDLRPRVSPSEVVEIMRKAVIFAPIDLSPQASAGGAGGVGFTVSFEYDDAEIAARVANELVDLILQENIQSRTGQAAEAAKFFQQQSERLAQDLAKLEAQIADFKMKNGASLPDSLPYRRTLLLQLQSQLAELDQKIALADSDQVQPGAEARQVQIKRLSIHLDAERQQLASVSNERDSIKKLVKDGVVARTRLMDLDRTAATMQADIDTTITDIDAARRHVESDNLVDPDATVVAKLTKEREQLQGRISDLNGSILTTPEVDAALEKLTRDHDDVQVQYRDAMAKAATAATSEDLERSRQAERLEVIERATPPTKPVKPRRSLIILAGGLTSGLAGLGMLIARELLDRRIWTVADIERRLQVRTISVIPYFPIPAERSRRRLRPTILVIVIAGAFATIPLEAFIPQMLAMVGLR